MAESKCKKCEHYDKTDDLRGNCRRYPPILHKNDTEKFPVVSKDDVCGEFKEKI
jgi:hypothetical protein